MKTNLTVFILFASFLEAIQLDATTTTTTATSATLANLKTLVQTEVMPSYDSTESVRKSAGEVSKCGVRTTMLIAGGSNSIKGAWPWIATIFRKRNGRFFLTAAYCAGSIISPKFILTAAHCTAGQHESDFLVRLGEYDINVDEDHSVDVNVSRIIEHEDYDKLSASNDIALLELAEELGYSSHIFPICLPRIGLPKETFSGKEAVVAGWGTLAHDGDKSDILQVVRVPVVTNEECQKARALMNIRNSQLCAGYKEGGKDACQGDSGGPLMLDINGVYAVIGIVSFGYECARPGYYGVYARTTEYTSWIKRYVPNVQFA